MNTVPCYYLWFGVVYKRQYKQNTKLRKSMYMRVSLKIFAFLLNLLYISFNIYYFRILCRYKWHACRLTCTDKFPNVPTKLWKGSRYNDLESAREARGKFKDFSVFIVFLCWIKRFETFIVFKCNIWICYLFKLSKSSTIPPRKIRGTFIPPRDAAYEARYITK